LTYPLTPSHAPSAVFVTDRVYVFDEDAQNRLRVCENGGNCRVIDTPAAGHAYSGACTAAVEFGGVPHVFYVERLPDGRERLRHAARSPTNPLVYTVEVLDGPGTLNPMVDPIGRITRSVGGCPAAITFNGMLFLTYQDKTWGDLRLGRFDGAWWVLETLDGDRYDSVGRTSAFVGATSTFAALGNELYLYYPGDGGLREAVYAAWNNTWRFSIVDGTSGAFASVKAVTLGTAVNVFYTTPTSGLFSPLMLRQGRRFYSPKTGQLHFTVMTVDSSESVGVDVDAAVYGNVLHAFYYAQTNGNLRHAYLVNGAWVLENVDGHLNAGHSGGPVNANVGRHPAVVAGWSYPWVIYEDLSAGILRFAMP
jgi:hypothetical protein